LKRKGKKRLVQKLFLRQLFFLVVSAFGCELVTVADAFYPLPDHLWPVLRDHLVLEGPSGEPAELGHHLVARAQELDVEFNVVDGLAGS
jgi:hypothetical protein